MDKLKEKIDEVISTRNEVVRRELHVSDIYQCPRKIIFRIKGIPEKITARQFNIFQNGHAVHERIEGYFKKAGILIDSEQPIKENEMGIKGRYDLKFKDPNDNEIKIGDVKSINLRTLREPKKEHIAQVMLYMHFEGIRKGKLIYESKQTQELFYFDVEYDQITIESILGWFKDMQELVDKGAAPATNNDKNKFPCSWGADAGSRCPYYDICWK